MPWSDRSSAGWVGSTGNAWGSSLPQLPARHEEPAPVVEPPVVNRTYFLPEEINRASKTRTIVKEFDGITVKVFRTEPGELLVAFSGLRTSPGLVVGSGPALVDALVRLVVRGDKSRSATW